MSILVLLLDDIKEVAVVTAMNTAASALRICRPAGGTDAAKEELKNLITADMQGDSTIIFTLNLTESFRVGPLYCAFGAAWSIPRVTELVMEFLRKAPVLDGVKFDIQMRTR